MGIKRQSSADYSDRDKLRLCNWWSSDMAAQAGKHSLNKALQNLIPPGETLIFRMADLPAAPLVFSVRVRHLRV